MKKTFEYWTKSILELEQILKDLGLRVPTGGQLEDAALLWLGTEYTAEGNPRHDDKKDFRGSWRRAISLGDLAEKIVAVRDKPDFGKLVPHLRLLVGRSDSSQFSYTDRNDPGNNYIFELWVGAACLLRMEDIRLDAPDGSSGGTNPDITGRYGSRRWGIACKALNSWAVPDQGVFTASPEGFVKLVKDGVRQIEACDTIDRGIVMVAMKNTFSHDAMWPAEADGRQEIYYGAYPSLEAAAKPIHDEFGAFQKQVYSLYGSKRAFFDDVFAGGKAATPILLAYPTVTGILHQGQPAFTLLNSVCAMFDDDRKMPEATRFAQMLSACLQNRPEMADLAPVELE